MIIKFIVNLIKTIKSNNLTQENILNLTQIVYYLLMHTIYLLNAYVNMLTMFIFETNHRNGLVYILI